MNLRKIAVVGSFAAGAALALAPLAAADFAAVDPLLPFVDGEVASLNALFLSDRHHLADDGGDCVIIHDTPPCFDIINATDVAAVQGNGTTLFDFLAVREVDPAKAGLASDRVPFTEFNGALARISTTPSTSSCSRWRANPTAVIDTIPLCDRPVRIRRAVSPRRWLASHRHASRQATFLQTALADLLRVFSAIPSP